MLAADGKDEASISSPSATAKTLAGPSQYNTAPALPSTAGGFCLCQYQCIFIVFFLILEKKQILAVFFGQKWLSQTKNNKSQAKLLIKHKFSMTCDSGYPRDMLQKKLYFSPEGQILLNFQFFQLVSCFSSIISMIQAKNHIEMKKILKNMKEILFWYRFVGPAQLNSLQRSDTQKIWGLNKLFKLKMCLLFRNSYEDQKLS